MENIYYNKDRAKEKHHRNLPHWYQDEKLYFVTFRLADSIPAEKLQKLKEDRQRWELLHKQPYSQNEWQEYSRLFNRRIENWLDNCHGDCVLKRPECGKLLAETLEYFNGERYLLDHWIIMPNHVHILVVIMNNYKLEDITHSWKSFTANKINKIIGQKKQLWQHESFDHIVRSTKQLEKFREYIVGNADKAPKNSILSKNNILAM